MPSRGKLNIEMRKHGEVEHVDINIKANICAYTFANETYAADAAAALAQKLPPGWNIPRVRTSLPSRAGLQQCPPCSESEQYSRFMLWGEAWPAFAKHVLCCCCSRGGAGSGDPSIQALSVCSQLLDLCSL